MIGQWFPGQPRKLVVELRGKVVPKNDPRHVVRGGRAWAYVSKEELEYREALHYAAKLALQGRPPLQGPVAFDLTVYRDIPKYMGKLKRHRAINELEYPDTRPDLSNYIKMVEDAFSRIVYVDDNQVVTINARKRYGEVPGMRAEIEEYMANEEGSSDYE